MHFFKIKYYKSVPSPPPPPNPLPQLLHKKIYNIFLKAMYSLFADIFVCDQCHKHNGANANDSQNIGFEFKEVFVQNYF